MRSEAITSTPVPVLSSLPAEHIHIWEITCKVHTLDLWGSASFSLFVLKKRRSIDYIRETNQKKLPEI